MQTHRISKFINSFGDKFDFLINVKNQNFDLNDNIFQLGLIIKKEYLIKNILFF